MLWKVNSYKFIFNHSFLEKQITLTDKLKQTKKFSYYNIRDLEHYIGLGFQITYIESKPKELNEFSNKDQL